MNYFLYENKEAATPNIDTLGDLDSRTTSGVVRPHFEVDTRKGRNSLLLPVGDTELVDRHVLEQLSALGFVPKSEFHVTAFDDKPGSKIALLIHSLPEIEQASLFEFIWQIAQKDQWEIHSRDEFYVLEKQYPGEDSPRRSVVQMVDCPSFDTFYTALAEFLPDGSMIEVPPAHITLATQGNPRGIGISTLADIRELAV